MAALAIALLAVTPAGGRTVLAQPVDDTLHPALDLSIVVENYADARVTAWRITVENNPVGRHPGAVARRVEVKIVLTDHAGATSATMWTIQSLGPGDKVTRRVDRPSTYHHLDPLKIVGLYAEVIESDPGEPPGFQFNNASEHWGNTKVEWLTDGDTAVGVRISDRFPPVGGGTTFTVEAANFPGDRYGFPASSLATHTQLDVQLEISLSPGLAFAGTPQAPDGTTFDPATGIWDVGTLERTRGAADRRSLPVAVNLTADSLADLPLEERCLTAKVVRAVPWFAFDRSKRENDTATVCLGEDPKVLLTNGYIELFDFFDCVGRDTFICTGEDTLELVAAASRKEIDLPGLDRIDLLGHIGHGTTFLKPETVVVHIQDPSGRHDGKWKTGRTRYHDDEEIDPIPGIGVAFTWLGSGWSAYITEVSDVDPKQRPGSVSFNDGDDASYLSLDPDARPSDGPWNLSETFTSKPTPTLISFSTLGTYKLDMTIGATEAGIPYTDSGTYTFHVGPVAELEVRDAGANPEVARGKRAYTITALNNGPDEAPVEVRLSPLRIPAPSIDNAIPSEGSYRDGVWTIDELQPREARRANGRSEGPTLTVFTESDVPFRAVIAPAREYCVRIKTGATDPANDLECSGDLPTGYTEHSAVYYDHIPGNNSAQIEAHAGTGSYPGAPAGLTVLDIPVGNILQWEPVAMLHGHPVTHYQVQRLEPGWVTTNDVTGTIHLDKDFASGTPQYRVRAVNRMGVAGPWSTTPAQEGFERAQAADPAQPPDSVTGLTARPGDRAVDLEWRSGSSAGRPDVWHQLWRSDDQTWRDIAPRAVGSSNLGYTVTGLENGREYIFRVRAVTQSEYGDLVPGVSSGSVLATPVAPPEPEPGQPPPPGVPSGPNNPPEFDRDSVWYPETPWCANAGARRGTEVARFSATDPDGDSLQYFQRTGFEEIADAYFTVTTVTSGNVDYGVVRVSRTLPADLSPDDGFIIIDLEVIDGRGGLDQIGLSLQYDSTGGSCR